jgi:hypothetical protein
MLLVLMSTTPACTAPNRHREKHLRALGIITTIVTYTWFDHRTALHRVDAGQRPL